VLVPALKGSRRPAKSTRHTFVPKQEHRSGEDERTAEGARRRTRGVSAVDGGAVVAAWRGSEGPAMEPRRYWHDRYTIWRRERAEDMARGRGGVVGQRQRRFGTQRQAARSDGRTEQEEAWRKRKASTGDK